MQGCWSVKLGVIGDEVLGCSETLFKGFLTVSRLYKGFRTAYELQNLGHLDLHEKTAGLVLTKTLGVANAECVWT